MIAMEKGTKVRQTVDTSNSDREFVAAFESDLRMLYEMVIEMVQDNKEYLLSPVMRRLLIDKAKLVCQRHEKITGRITVDNPGENLFL